jgi:hypothetical protein
MPAAHDPRTKALLGLTALAVAAATLVGCGSEREASVQPAQPPADLQAQVEERPHAVFPAEATRSRPIVPHFPVGAMPTGDRPGWKQVLAQDFLGATVPGGFATYEGRPGGNPYGYWQHRRVVATGDDLRLHGSWVGSTFMTGGLMQVSKPQTYGKWEVRFKVGTGEGVSYALLLWPSTGRWPEAGEIDFAEDGGGSRSGITATLHHGADNAQVQKRVQADFTQFQTVGVEWTPGRLVYTLNGKPWATLRSDDVPTGPMNLALQLEAGHGTAWSAAPSRRTPAAVDLVVDWVVVYRRA